MRGMIRICCVVSIIFVMLSATGCEASEDTVFQEISMEELDEEGTSGDSKDEPEMIYVHVCGEVKCPGVYEFEMGSRIFEAIEAAGGMTKSAAENSINQAEILSDGQQLYIHSEEELQEQKDERTAATDGKLNINKASKEELMTLPGIGEAKADAIIRYREEQRSFGSVEEIMEIEGIKEGVFHKIKDEITIS